jgi:hypothetical protein
VATDFNPVQAQDVVNTFKVNDILGQAYRMARALKHPGQGISQSESDEGLYILNSMVDDMKTDSLFIVFMQRSEQTVNIGQKVYGVGPGQDFDIPRPPKIHRAGFLVVDPNNATNEAEVAMRVLLTYEEYQDYIVKNVPSTIPLAIYYQASTPYGSATVWPVPSLISQIVIYVPSLLSEFSTVDDVLEMPYGYRKMLEYNLAVEVHMRYPENPMDPKVYGMAAYTKSKVKANQWTPMFIGSDPAVMQESRRSQLGGTPRAWVPYT